MTIHTEKLLILIEDDASLARALQRSFERKNYTVMHAASHEEMLNLLDKHIPTYAVVDMKLEGKISGLHCVKSLFQHNPMMRIVVLTGFASINTAVEAIKLGACQYLPKPANTDDIEVAFAHVAGQQEPLLTRRQTSIKNLEWERIHEVLKQTDFNISETARRLGMHRRTLARKLEKQRIR